MRISDWSSDVCSSDLRGAAVGIAVELRLLRLVGGNGQRARAQRILIGGKADHAVHAGGLGLATDVGRDLQDAGARLDGHDATRAPEARSSAVSGTAKLPADHEIGRAHV